MTLDKAIKLLEREYEKAKGLEVVYNPIAYALYKVWKMADGREPINVTQKTLCALDAMDKKAHGGQLNGQGKNDWHDEALCSQ